MRLTICAVVACATAAWGPAQARDVIKAPRSGEKVVCKGGNFLEPFVPDPKTAIAIFLAVEAARVPNADMKNFPSVDVLERNGHWDVFRYNPKLLGGGQLELEISKCTGQIIRAGFTK